MACKAIFHSIKGRKMELLDNSWTKVIKLEVFIGLLRTNSQFQLNL